MSKVIFALYALAVVATRWDGSMVFRADNVVCRPEEVEDFIAQEVRRKYPAEDGWQTLHQYQRIDDWRVLKVADSLRE